MYRFYDETNPFGFFSVPFGSKFYTMGKDGKIRITENDILGKLLGGTSMGETGRDIVRKMEERLNGKVEYLEREDEMNQFNSEIPKKDVNRLIEDKTKPTPNDTTNNSSTYNSDFNRLLSATEILKIIETQETEEQIAFGKNMKALRGYVRKQIEKKLNNHDYSRVDLDSDSSGYRFVIDIYKTLPLYYDDKDGDTSNCCNDRGEFKVTNKHIATIVDELKKGGALSVKEVIGGSFRAFNPFPTAKDSLDILCGIEIIYGPHS